MIFSRRNRVGTKFHDGQHNNPRNPRLTARPHLHGFLLFSVLNLDQTLEAWSNGSVTCSPLASDDDCRRAFHHNDLLLLMTLQMIQDIKL